MRINLASAILAITVTSGCIGHGQHWSAKDYALETAFLAVEAVDYQQTRIITSQCREANPLIGSCGQNAPINLFFPLTIVANVIVADLLPGWWRTSFQVFTTGVETHVVAVNYGAGIR